MTVELNRVEIEDLIVACDMEVIRLDDFIRQLKFPHDKNVKSLIKGYRKKIAEYEKLTMKLYSKL